MRAFALIALGVIIGGRLTAWLLKRWQPRLADALRMGVIVCTQLFVAVIFAWTALAAAKEDEPLVVALGVACGVLAVASLALAGFYVWMFFGSDRRPAGPRPGV